ncbi:hypothetical protein [Rhodocyclus tenuis]|uniref:hypothetical protein n=1 Tax=Rhodocyclus tenuis TaxID=1066 RepID=UPI001904314E|nr:hypothetical protein [Rhodocyclus tenuis]MBK1681420.1 hypothetical protein [Rhodocyclus tenuis]
MPTVLLIVIALLASSVALGMFLGWRYLRQLPAKPVLVGVHILLGLAGLKWMVIDLLWRTPEGTALHSVGYAAALLLAAALLSGLLAPVLAGPQPAARGGPVAQVLHAGVGLAGFALFIVWATNL